MKDMKWVKRLVVMWLDDKGFGFVEVGEYQIACYKDKIKGQACFSNIKQSEGDTKNFFMKRSRNIYKCFLKSLVPISCQKVFLKYSY